MTVTHTQSLRWMYFLYGILVIGMTVFLLYGRPPITDKNITWAEIFFLAPGIMLYLPILLLSGGVHWSILPFWARMPFWGTLNVLGYLAIPVVTQGIFRSWREWKKSGKQGNFWLELLRRPSVLVVVGVSCMLLGLNGILQIWRGTVGPTDFANAVLGPLAAIGFWFLAYYLYRHGAVIRLTDKGLPAWIRWAVPLAALTGAVIGGRLAYGEARIVGWSTTSAGALAAAVTGITVLMILIAFRLVQRQMK